MSDEYHLSEEGSFIALQNRIRDLEARVVELSRRGQTAEGRAEAAEARCTEYESRARNIEAIECAQRARADAAEARCAELGGRAKGAEATVDAVYKGLGLEGDAHRGGDAAWLVGNVVENYRKLQTEMRAAEARAKVLESELLGFVEYFGAIERGSVGPSRPKIRTFEKVLLDGARQALQAVPREEGDK